MSFIKNKILKPGYHFIKDNLDFKSSVLTKKNSDLNNKYKDQRCFLIMSGESINMIDFQKLKSEFTFGVNWTFINDKINQLPLTFLLSTMFSDRDYLTKDRIEEYWPPGYNMPEQAHKIIKQKLLHSKTKVFLKADDFRYFKSSFNYNLNDPSLYFIKYKNNFDLGKKMNQQLHKRFSLLPGGGSFYTSIILLIMMGFKKIYLCGAGYTYDPIFFMHFYDNYSLPNSTVRTKAKTHFDSLLRKRNHKMKEDLTILDLYEYEDQVRPIIVKNLNKDKNLLNNHKIINTYAKMHDVKITNIIPSGFSSPIFDSTTFEKVFI